MTHGVWQVSEEDRNRTRQLLTLLVGGTFGSNPEIRVDEIRVRKAEQGRFISFLLGLGPDDVVLDLGSGMGLIARVIAPAVKRLICCDMNADFLEYAKAELAHLTNVELVRLDRPRRGYAAASSIASKSVDAAYASAVFIHLSLFDIQRYLLEMARVLRPGGRLVFDIKSADRIGYAAALFEEHSGYYRDMSDEARLSELMQWNSEHAVRYVAEQAGFRVQSQIVLSDASVYFSLSLDHEGVPARAP